MATWSQSMQRTWWQVASSTTVTGSYWPYYIDVAVLGEPTELTLYYNGYIIEGANHHYCPCETGYHEIYICGHASIVTKLAAELQTSYLNLIDKDWLALAIVSLKCVSFGCDRCEVTFGFDSGVT